MFFFCNFFFQLTFALAIKRYKLIGTRYNLSNFFLKSSTGIYMQMITKLKKDKTKTDSKVLKKKKTTKSKKKYESYEVCSLE